VHLVELQIGAHVDCALELLVRLAAEADDDVGMIATSGTIRAHPFDQRR
jgi:hypothetical protein